MIHVDASELAAVGAEMLGYSASVQPRAEQAVARVAFTIERAAQAGAPVDTGTLKNSISSDVHGLRAEIGPTVEYGDYVEHGTSKMSAQPYMGPAFDAHAPTLDRALGTIGEQVLG